MPKKLKDDTSFLQSCYLIYFVFLLMLPLVFYVFYRIVFTSTTITICAWAFNDGQDFFSPNLVIGVSIFKTLVLNLYPWFLEACEDIKGERSMSFSQCFPWTLMIVEDISVLLILSPNELLNDLFFWEANKDKWST